MNEVYVKKCIEQKERAKDGRSFDIQMNRRGL